MAAQDAVVSLRSVDLVHAGTPPVHAVRSVDLDVHPGEHVAITGASGSGKSSLLNVMALLCRPTSGEVHLGGVPTAALDERQRTEIRGRSIGFVFQDFNLLPHRSAAQNVELGLAYGPHRAPLRRVRQELAAEALERVGMTSRAHAMPSEMSGGERQRVAFARAVVGQRSMLVCDEPTGSLDSDNTSNIMGLLADFCAAGLAVVVVTHDDAVARCAERVHVMADGVLREASPRPGGVA